MTDVDDVEQSDPGEANPFHWGLVGLSFVILLAVIAGRFPASISLPGGRQLGIKLLGLFSIGFGLLCGWGLGLWAKKCAIGRSQEIFIATFLMIAAGTAVMHAVPYGLVVASVKEQFEEQPPALLPSGLQEQNQAERARLLASRIELSAYLARRVSSLGQWNRPWPELFCLAEILLGSAAGTWLFARTLQGNVPAR